MSQKPDDILIVEGNNELNVALNPLSSGFTFGTIVATEEVDFLGQGFYVAQVTCNLSNQSSGAQTRRIKCGWQKVSDLTNMGYRGWDYYSLEYELTLNPRETMTLVSPSHIWDPTLPYWRSNAPTIIASTLRQWYYWMEDDLGNMSEKVTA